MDIQLTANTIITAAAVLTAILTLLGALFAVHKWYLKQEKQDRDIVQIKEENTLLVYGLRACLDGLEQLGANHTVPDAKNKLDKYINQQAHK